MRKHEKRGRERLIKTEKSWNDHLLIFSAISSPVWRAVLRDRNAAFLLMCKYAARFINAIVNKCFCSVMRSNAGVNQSGIVISLCACLYLAAFNSREIWPMLSGAGMIYIPVSLSWKSFDLLYDMLVIDIYSTILLCYNAILLITSIAEIIRVFTGRTNLKDISSRGTSRIYLGLKWLFKRLKINPFQPDKQFLEGIVEPAALFSVGTILLQYDFWAAIFVFMMATSETIIQINNKAATLKHLKLVHMQNPNPKPRG